MPSKNSPAKDDTVQNGVRHDASEEARTQAMEKMRQARQEAAASGENVETADEDKRQIEERDIDPKAERALKDLLKVDKDKSPTKLKKVKIYSPFRVYYDNEATSVSAVNLTGPFDVLPGHKNFLSLLGKGNVIVRRESGKEESIAIERGIMHVNGDEVRIFLDV